MDRNIRIGKMFDQHSKYSSTSIKKVKYLDEM